MEAGKCEKYFILGGYMARRDSANADSKAIAGRRNSAMEGAQVLGGRQREEMGHTRASLHSYNVSEARKYKN